MLRIRCIKIVLTTILLCAFSDAYAESTNSATGFHPLSTTIDGQQRAGSVYIPEDYDSGKKYPLIVFLHGSGERGNDGELQTTVGVGKAIRENPERFHCLVYIPQCPADDDWSGRQPGGDGTSSHAHIQQGIDEIVKNYSIDSKRISITGLSMGGRGTFSFGAKNAKQFSAFMPVCGQASKRLAPALSTRPIWIFHGDADTVVPPRSAQMLAKAIREEGGKVKFTLYTGVGHNSWDLAYSKSEGAIEWLLKQKK